MAQLSGKVAQIQLDFLAERSVCSRHNEAAMKQHTHPVLTETPPTCAASAPSRSSEACAEFTTPTDAAPDLELAHLRVGQPLAATLTYRFWQTE